MYLYRYESGQNWQLETPPTETDFEIMENGSLAVFVFKDGKFFEVVDHDRVEQIETGRVLTDEATGKPYSGWADEEP